MTDLEVRLGLPATPVVFPFCMVNLQIRTTGLLLVAFLSALSTEASAQSKGTHRRSHKVHHKATHSVRTSHASAKSSYGRKGQIGVSVTFERTTSKEADADRDLDKTVDAADMTSGYMTTVFRKQKGHLPWPVDSRNIATSFGYQRYEPNPSIYRNNLGINIAIDKDSCVRVVYDGVVDDVMDIGDAKAVIVAHGKYFSIYSDLSMSIVNKGQVVAAGDVIGQVGETGQVDFRIFDPNDVWQDPVKWLERKKKGSE